MDILTFLKRIRAERLELLRLDEEREDLYLSLLPSGIRYDRDRVQTSPSDKMPEIAGKLEQIDQRIKKRSAKLLADIELAHAVIDEVPTSECRELLTLRYLMGGRKPNTWIQIAEAMDYSIDHVQGKLHSKAINEARMVWKKREQDRTG